MALCRASDTGKIFLRFKTSQILTMSDGRHSITVCGTQGRAISWRARSDALRLLQSRQDVC